MSRRPFHLMVDSGAHDEPGSRYFGSLEAALEAAERYDDRWKPFVWITEWRRGEDRLHVYVKDGRPVKAGAADRTPK